MKTFCERLVEERKRLNKNQDEFSALGGVKRGAQIKYESGERSPDSDYLSKIAEAGADVNYILTGHRTNLQDSGHSDRRDGRRGYDVNPRIAAIVALLEELSEESQNRIQDAAEREKQVAELKAELVRLKAG